MKRIFLIVALVFISILNVNAQNASESDISIGIYSGYGFNQFYYDYTPLSIHTNNIEFEGNNFFAGLLGEVEFLNQKVDLRLEYSKFKLNKVQNNDTSIYRIEPHTTSQIFEKNEIDVEMLSLAVNYKFELVKNLNINPGVKFSYVNQSNELIYLDLSELEGRIIIDPRQEYINNYHGLVLKRGQLHENDLQIYASLGVDYEIELMPSLMIQPEIKYFYSLTELSSTISSKLHYYNLGLAIKYEL